MKAKQDVTNQQFGRLTAVNRSAEDPYKWNCQCVCGKMVSVRIYALLDGHTQSCGCFMREQTSKANSTHGMVGTPEYYSWASLIQRCTNPKTENYDNYGGRGIRVCDRWLNSFENFYNDMGPKPTPEHSIDRFPDNDGNYEPSNCRWATASEQQNNKRERTWEGVYSYQGRTWTARELAKAHGITNLVAFRNRLTANWDIEKALTTPIIDRPR